MERYRQLKPLVISDFESEKWEHPVHKHNHYELIFIKKGTGNHYINELAIPYREGDVFLLGPEEEHYFDIHSSTRFIYIKFTDSYLYQENTSAYGSVRHLEYLIKSRETHLSGFSLTEPERETVAQIVNVIISLKGDKLQNENLIWLQMLSIATILQRNMPELKISMSHKKDIQALFCYLHKYIYQPEMLRAMVLAEHFNTTADYIGPYFKRNTGITLRDYMRDYRNSLITARMKSGNYGLKQIAAEFGLTDESHVSRILKQVSTEENTTIEH
ncbi:AraC family transcriptional regulator [Arcticibacter eurypsychrophilus]|uniref:AraC family transcriptional regulator n=1 Tax=Arcticibacter eurypsychrophilus TaxID=1434752 RepID=UPI00084D6613|nr:helix-turn-helix transcriptional regulator [Arcticibacter eurypsychrophilus]